MSRTLTPIDISHLPDLLRIAEEVKDTKTPHVLKRDNKTVAMLMPVGTTVKPEKKPKPTKADYETFFSAFGSWKDVDTEKLKRDMRYTQPVRGRATHAYDGCAGRLNRLRRFRQPVDLPRAPPARPLGRPQGSPLLGTTEPLRGRFRGDNLPWPGGCLCLRIDKR